MKFLFFLVSFYLLMINVIGAPVYKTHSAINPESSVTTTPPKYTDSATETVNKAFANTTETTQKGILFYILNCFEFFN